MTIATICNGCYKITTQAIQGRCPPCRSIAEQERHQRRKTDPHQKIVLSAQWGKVRKLIRARDRGCVRAGQDCFGPLQVHYIVPVRLGGAPYDPDNLETVCRHHHEQAEREARLRRSVLARHPDGRKFL